MNDDDRLAGIGQDLAHAVEECEPPVGQIAHRAQASAGRRAHVTLQRGRHLGGAGDPFAASPALDEVGEDGLRDVDDRLVGDPILTAGAFKHGDAGGAKSPRDLAEQAPLADAERASDERYLPGATHPSLLTQRQQPLELGLATHTRCLEARARRFGRSCKSWQVSIGHGC